MAEDPGLHRAEPEGNVAAEAEGEDGDSPGVDRGLVAERVKDEAADERAVLGEVKLRRHAASRRIDREHGKPGRPEIVLVEGIEVDRAALEIRENQDKRALGAVLLEAEERPHGLSALGGGDFPDVCRARVDAKRLPERLLRGVVAAEVGIGRG